MNAGVFLDRDGTLIEEVGYLDSISQVRLLQHAGLAVRILNEAGFKVFIITNQSGVARGMFPEALVHDAHARIAEELAEAGAHLDAIYYCPHHPQGRVEEYRVACDCRKPKPGMLLRAAGEWKLDLARCFVVGDKYLDVQTAHAAGALGVLVLSGYGREEHLQRHSWPRPPDFIAEDVLRAAEWIVGTAHPR